MFATIKGIIQNKDLRNKVLFVLGMLLLYKIGTHITSPGINKDYLKAFQNDNGLLAFMNTISGGSLKTFSIFAVGIMPYITASIIIQLLQMDIVPKLTEWSKQGEAGKKKTKNLTRVLTVILAILQSTGMALSFNRMYPGLVENPGFVGYLIVVVALTIGTVLLMVMGELIDKKGIGNGISILIFAGIVSSIPNTASMFYVSEIQTNDASQFIGIAKTVILLICLLVVLVGIIYINQAYRRVQIKYPNQGGSGGFAKESYMPIKLNVAGVIPVIFSVAILMFPATIARFFPTNEVAIWITNNLNYQQPFGAALYVILIIAFSYFYTFVQMNPEKTAKDLKESGGFIPGYHPGKPTEDFFRTTLMRLTFVGSIYLAVVAALPIVFGQIAGLPTQVQVGGTSLIIAVGVALDVYQRIETQIKQKQYKGFL